jgi:hypothetical protein
MTIPAQQSTLSASNVHPKVFVVRLWAEPHWVKERQASSSVWRASVHHPETGQRWYFSRPTELANFLLEAGPDKTLLEEDFP